MTHPRWNPQRQPTYRNVPHRPQLGVVERAEGYEVVAELPSSQPEDVSVQLEEGHLTIRARWPEAVASQDHPAGWQVSVVFGDLVRGDARIVVQDGILFMTLPKSDTAPRGPTLSDEAARPPPPGEPDGPSQPSKPGDPPQPSKPGEPPKPPRPGEPPKPGEPPRPIKPGEPPMPPKPGVP